MSNPLQIAKIDLKYLMNLVKAETKREINCHAIGTVITFDASTATATVAFNYKKILRNRNAVSINQNNDVIVDYPVLIRVPVIVMSGGGGYTTYPIFPGDQCLLMFCDRDIDNWLEKGSTNSAPLSDRMHDISDAVALVGLNPVTKPIPWAMDGIVTAIGQVVMKFTSALASIVDSTGQRLCQSGFGQVHFGAALPPGWLWCDGGSYLVAAYPTLFASIGYTYGGGGVTFMVPDMRGRVPIGLDNINGSNAGRLAGNAFVPSPTTLGAPGGEALHSQTIAELVPHFHNISDQCNSQSGSGRVTVGGDSPEGPDPFTDYTGGGQPFNVVQPGLMCNYIIKI